MNDRTVYIAEPTQSTHSNKKEIDVPSFEQKYSWDCGLACVCMVLRHLGIDDSKIYKEDHTDLDCGDSVWTIDLAFLLQKYGIKNRLTTTTLGVDKGYGSSSFYKASFTKDENRVNTLFQEAESKGIVVEKGSVPMDEILNHLEGDNLVIALVDWSYLECIWCDKLGISCLTCLKRCTKCCDRYQGHYIVLCGFDRKKNRIFYKNPSYNKDMCCSRISEFNLARKSYGTDEDTLFIYNDT
ncbi:protein GUCD1-like [Mytilus galloprovincialis]|uniref:protein GUCD1-like n=1 Tax=Mytilus galloprovincialis TaxID=29158 RepID=UPI003F7CBDC4